MLLGILSMSEEQPIRQDTMLKVDGKPFRCECGCNVFTKVSDVRYECNACEQLYEGSSVRTEPTEKHPS